MSGRTTPEEAERAVPPNLNRIPSKEGTDMRFTKLLGVFFVALTTVLFATPILAQEGRTYEMQITQRNADGTVFTGCDCLTFSDEAPGVMRSDALGAPFLWAHTDLNESRTGWQAIGPVHGLAKVDPQVGVLSANSVTLHGSVNRRESLISADGLVSNGATAVLDGFENPECSLLTCEVN